MLLALSSIVSFAQIGNQDLTCYTQEELRHIADRMVFANECEELLVIINLQLDNKKLEVFELNQVIAYKDSVINLKDSIIQDHQEIQTLQNYQLDQKNEEIQTLKKRLFWTKVGWVATVVGSVVLLLLN